MFRYLASLLYFFDRLDKLLALESIAAGRRNQRKEKRGRRGETQIRSINLRCVHSHFYYLESHYCISLTQKDTNGLKTTWTYQREPLLSAAPPLC